MKREESEIVAAYRQMREIQEMHIVLVKFYDKMPREKVII